MVSGNVTDDTSGVGGPAGGRDPSDPTALDALGALASSEVVVADHGTHRLVHRETYTRRGLLSLFWHQPTAERRVGAGVVASGGAMGGVLGPGHGLYHVLGEALAARGLDVIRVGYREPNNVDLCAHDVACGVELVRDAGSGRVVVMGHSFGGAAVVRAAVVMAGSVVGVVTFATQSAGCEVAGGLNGRPLLMFHGDRDELLPPEASYVVQAIAGTGEVVILPGDGHVLGRSDDAIRERLDEWLPAVLGI